MTNKEKYIVNASNEELSLLLGYGAILKDNKLSTPLQEDIEKRYYFEERRKLAQNSKDIQEWLSQEAEKTADEMFEELGYKKFSSDALCEYIKELRGGETTFFLGRAHNAKKIVINDSLEYWSNIAIDEAEDKAIHKKIEELKQCIQ